MCNCSHWNKVTDVLPEERRLIEVQDTAGQVHRLRRKGLLWFHHDYSMYVYFVPTFWRYASERVDTW